MGGEDVIRKVNVFALPYAGGTATMYSKIGSEFVQGNINFIPIEYSGHGIRCTEKLRHSIREIAEDVYYQIKSYDLEQPYCILGYSMGCLVAYELYYLLVKKRNRLPFHMIMCSMPGLQVVRTNDKMKEMNEEELIDKLIRLKATPMELIQNKNVLSFFLPQIKADFGAYENYNPTKHYQGIEAGGTIVYGNEEFKSISDLKQWDEIFGEKCDYIEMPGDHFFIVKNYRVLAELIRSIVSRNNCYLELFAT